MMHRKRQRSRQLSEAGMENMPSLQLPAQLLLPSHPTAASSNREHFDSPERTQRSAVAHIGRYPIPSADDIDRLADYKSGLLTDQIIDFALASYQQELQVGSVMLVSAGTLLMNGDPGEYDSNNVKRMQAQVARYDFVLLPLALDGHHTIALWIPQAERLYYYDSLRRFGTRSSNIGRDSRATFTRDAVRRRFGVERVQLVPGRGPRQQDGINCGAFVIAVGCALMKRITELRPGEEPNPMVRVPTPDRRLGNEVRKWVMRVVCSGGLSREEPRWLQNPWREEEQQSPERVRACLPVHPETSDVEFFSDNDGVVNIVSQDAAAEQELRIATNPAEEPPPKRRGVGSRRLD